MTSHDAWVNLDAFRWVVYETDKLGAPPTAHAVYLVVAVHTGPDGRGSRSGRLAIAREARKSVSSVKRDLTLLVEKGWLLQGDSRLVAHLPPNERPNVYDLPDVYRDWLTRGSTMNPRVRTRGSKVIHSGVQIDITRGSTMDPKEVLKKELKTARTRDDANASRGADVADLHELESRNGKKDWEEAREVLRKLGLHARELRNGEEPS